MRLDCVREVDSTNNIERLGMTRARGQGFNIFQILDKISRNKHTMACDRGHAYVGLWPFVNLLLPYSCFPRPTVNCPHRFFCKTDGVTENPRGRLTVRKSRAYVDRKKGD